MNVVERLRRRLPIAPDGRMLVETSNFELQGLVGTMP